MSSSNSGAVYGGDEINAIVLDPGSYNTRIGYSGDDFPKVVTPSCYGVKKGEERGKNKKIFGDAIGVPRSNYNVEPILKDSIILDWDAAIEQYKHYFNSFLKIDYKEQPILITEPVWTEFKYRQELVETFYENFDFPALYLARSPSCVSFQQGRPNCLVVDVGHQSVSVTPIVDGISLLKNSMRTHYAGEFLNDQIQDMLAKKYPTAAIQNSYQIKSKTPVVYPNEAKYELKNVPSDITQSFEDYEKQKIWQEFKETALEVPEKKINSHNSDTYSQDTYKRLFEFPTGQSIELSIERFQLADALFDPLHYKFTSEKLQAKYPPNNGEFSIDSVYGEYRPLKRARKAESNQSSPPPQDSPETQVRGLSQLISHTLSTIDIDLRPSVAHNIIVTGGVSLIPQLTERLYNELSATNPGLKIRLHAAGNSSERLNQAWIGGSVLASLGTFHQMWVSKAEYDEAGPERIITQRFR